MALDPHAEALGPLELGPHLLGAIASPPDARDFPIVDLIDWAAPLPARYLAPLMPPVLNQGNTGRCVDFSFECCRQWEARHAGMKTFPNLDADWLYHHTGGTADEQGGTIPRVALDYVLHNGIPLVGHPETAAEFKIAAYYAVPHDEETIKRAVQQFGPLQIATAWHNNQFTPVKGILPAPTGPVVGGHARGRYGWDDAVRGIKARKIGCSINRNSWAKTWGDDGSSYDAWEFDVSMQLSDVWKITLPAAIAAAQERLADRTSALLS